MADISKKSMFPLPLAVGIVACAAGVGLGWFAHGYMPAAGATTPAAGGGSGGGGGGGGGGMAAMGAAMAHPKTGTLLRTVRGLALLDTAASHPLTADEKQKLQAILKPVSGDAPMTE